MVKKLEPQYDCDISKSMFYRGDCTVRTIFFFVISVGVKAGEWKDTSTSLVTIRTCAE